MGIWSACTTSFAHLTTGAATLTRSPNRSGSEVTPVQLIFGNRSVRGWASGIPTDSEDTLRFAALTGVRPMIERYPLTKAGDAYARMLSGKAEFRVVLTM